MKIADRMVVWLLAAGAIACLLQGQSAAVETVVTAAGKVLAEHDRYILREFCRSENAKTTAWQDAGDSNR